MNIRQLFKSAGSWWFSIHLNFKISKIEVYIGSACFGCGATTLLRSGRFVNHNSIKEVWMKSNMCAGFSGGSLSHEFDGLTNLWMVMDEPKEKAKNKN